MSENDEVAGRLPIASHRTELEVPESNSIPYLGSVKNGQGRGSFVGTK